MCSPVPQSPDDPIYERHARTPVKDKPMSRAITPDVMKVRVVMFISFGPNLGVTLTIGSFKLEAESIYFQKAFP